MPWIVGARVTTYGTPLRRDVFFISNHVSWVDILALAGAIGLGALALTTDRLYVSDPGRTTFETWGTMERVDQPGVVCAAGGATTIWVDFPQQKAAPLPDWMRRHLE